VRDLGFRGFDNRYAVGPATFMVWAGSDLTGGLQSVKPSSHSTRIVQLHVVRRAARRVVWVPEPVAIALGVAPTGHIPTRFRTRPQPGRVS
jgi:hypothetical protein